MNQFRFPRLSRGGKILRNLLLTLLLIVLAWGAAGFPINDPRLSFRRLEHANWFGPSDIQGVFSTKYEDVWVAATCEDQIIFHTRDSEYFESWTHQKDGPALAPVPEERLMEGEVWVLGTDVPAGTARAELSMRLTCHYNLRMNGIRMSAVPEGNCPDYFDRTYTVPGELLEDGGALFHVQGNAEGHSLREAEKHILSQAYDWDTYAAKMKNRSINCHMEARYYDASGAELGRAELDTKQ